MADEERGGGRQESDQQNQFHEIIIQPATNLFMKFIATIILIALLAFVSGLYLPWWSIALAAFVISLIFRQPPGKSFLAGFLGLFLLWAGLALFIDSPNQHILSKKIAEVLPLGGSSTLLILVTGLVGGLVGGFAALTASYLNKKK